MTFSGVLPGKKVPGAWSYKELPLNSDWTGFVSEPPCGLGLQNLGV